MVRVCQMPKCACGCGCPIDPKGTRGRVRRFLRGHSSGGNAGFPRIVVGDVTYKQCANCGMFKSLETCFSKRGASKQQFCKTCDKARAKKYTVEHYDDRMRYRRQWYRKNKPKQFALAARWRRHMQKTSESYRVTQKLRISVTNGIRRGCGAKKADCTEKLLGCSFAEARAHIERQFSPGMTWDNHGRYEGSWNIDHIIPISAFDLTNPDDQKRCFHYTNLQPLWYADNVRKNDFMPDGTRARRRQYA